MKRIHLLSLIATMLLVASAPAAAVTPQQKCQSTKNKAAGKYAACRQSAEAKLVLTADNPKYLAAIGKCEVKFASSWQKAITVATAAAVTCPDSPLTGPQFKTVIDEHSDNV